MQTAVQSLDPRALFEYEPEVWLRRSGGRETFLWSGGPGLDCVVKRHGNRERSIGAAWGIWFTRERSISPAHREYDNLVRLAADGFSVPRAITWCDELRSERGGSARSLVVMERITHRETLRDRLARVDARERRELLARLAAIVARFHDRGWHHRDLYVHHVALRDLDGAFVLLDLGRARRTRAARRPRSRWLVKDLGAVLHSCPPSVTRRERLEFVARWLDRMGIDGRARRRRWIAAVERKRARIAAHVPRDERVVGPHAP